jgi:hypothetical protein
MGLDFWRNAWGPHQSAAHRSAVNFGRRGTNLWLRAGRRVFRCRTGGGWLRGDWCALRQRDRRCNRRNRRRRFRRNRCSGFPLRSGFQDGDKPLFVEPPFFRQPGRLVIIPGGEQNRCGKRAGDQQQGQFRTFANHQSPDNLGFFADESKSARRIEGPRCRLGCGISHPSSLSQRENRFERLFCALLSLSPRTCFHWALWSFE